jgi:hypothetical protein
VIAVDPTDRLGRSRVVAGIYGDEPAVVRLGQVVHDGSLGLQSGKDVAGDAIGSAISAAGKPIDLPSPAFDLIAHSPTREN